MIDTVHDTYTYIHTISDASCVPSSGRFAGNDGQGPQTRQTGLHSQSPGELSN